MKAVISFLFALAGSCALFAESESQKLGNPGRIPAPPPTPLFMTSTQHFFQPVSMDPAVVRKNMQARSEYEELNRRVIARQSKIYEENKKVRELQKQLRELQNKIDAILDEDLELSALKKEMESITPEIPKGSRKGAPLIPPPTTEEKE